MLLVAGLLLSRGMITSVKLIYHEKEILDAESAHIAIMKKHFRDKVTVMTYRDAPKNIVAELNQLVIGDEADSALLD